MFPINTGLSEIPAKQHVTCSECGEPREIAKRLPSGWKRKGDDLFCKRCWESKFVLRAVAIPIAQSLDLTWEELSSTLHTMFQQTTCLSNWMITQLALLDVKRAPDQPKLAPMPRTYLYPQARIQFPDLPPQTIASLEQSITAKYRAQRFDLIWACKSSLPSFRYPQPFPVHNQSWKIELDNDRPVVQIRLGNGRVRLRLKGGPRFRHQTTAIKQLISNEAQAGQLSLYKQGGALMCKMIAWLPRREFNKNLSGTLLVRTSGDSAQPRRKSLLVALSENGEEVWTYHADQVLRWAAEHRTCLKRWADDSKLEARPRVPFAKRRQTACVKYRNRIDTACDQAAMYLCNYAKRKRFAVVRYDDSDTSFLLDFAWYRLRQRLSTILDECGVEFHWSNLASSEESGPDET